MMAASQAQHETVKKMVQQTSEDIAQQFKVLDDELGRELTKALSTLGSQLASLSNKFVNDYTPLTKQLQRLVQASSTNNTTRRGNRDPHT